MEDEQLVRSVQKWVESLVVELNLCPFAKRELTKNRVRFVVTTATNEEQLLKALQRELELMNDLPAIETTLLIHAKVLQDFYDYNEFLGVADGLLVQMGLEGIYQVASFHPDYQFGGTEPDDVENYTNRSPYPMLHLLREDSLSEAIDNYPEVDLIPERNIDCMNEQGLEKMQTLLNACLKGAGGK